ncbi:MAG: DNA polymerase III subunit alpha [candidate division WS2 bacterium]|uniref:DNA-directed DNA polymerase n=1 Tax=Psychracetigena formicireducens TaxID=2986056 RepID=A0A9E2F7A1_PSYF1|nr:DNA polymerase III subunit alpha [Candidatus Psychracetigena formicireducens]MBT9145363.1 DNA polymerase III subunit alpha [Candidatus Psychracetigena formicireducens]
MPYNSNVKIGDIKVDFAHLHVHSDYSLLDGFCPLKELVKKSKASGFNSLAITDHGVLYGLVEFSRECLKEGIKPILGIEAYQSPRLISNHIPREDDDFHHLVLLAKDAEGYQNLVKLSTISQVEGFWYKPRIDKEILSKYHKGLVALSACLAGEIPHKLLKGNYKGARESASFYKTLFGEDFYLELERHGLKEQQQIENDLIKISKELNIKLVATNDVHYLNKSDSLAHLSLLAIGTGSTVESPKIKFEGEEFYLKSYQEMSSLFNDLPEALTNTSEVVEKIIYTLPPYTPRLPRYPFPEPFTSQTDYLRHLVYEGLKKRYGLLLPAGATERVEYELSLINSMGFEGYFVIVADFVNFAKSREIPVGTGRGSSSGSLVSYALNITNIDPLKYGLFFERFLNPSRVALPDIDIDFCYNRREEVINYLREKYGEKSVAQIITFGTMKARGAIRDVGRVLSIPLNEVDRIAKRIPFGSSLKSAIEEVPELKDLYQNEGKYRELMDLSLRVEGRPRHASTHAAGVVIYEGDLTDLVPLQTSNSGLLTQYDMSSLETLGLLKIDILGLRTLTVMKETEDLIRMKIPDFSLEEIPLDDQKTFNLLKKANTIGVFQLESAGMRRILRELNPSNISDIMILLALYRPGPMDQINEFLARKKGKKKVEYPHQALQGVLTETYGIVVYQEQVIEMVRNVAGYSLSEADNLRAAIGKKKAAVIEAMKRDFMERTIAHTGVKKEEAIRLFQLIEAFSNYGFNKAHAASYAFTSYRTAYLKANYPGEYLTALMRNEEGSHERIALYTEEALTMNIPVLPPDISLSEARFSLTEKGIRFGLYSIKNVGEGAAQVIIEARKNKPFSSLRDFLSRVETVRVNKKSVESLIKAGAMDSLGVNRNVLLKELTRNGSNGYYNLTASNGSLFGSGVTEVKDEERKGKGYTEEELLELEKEMIGVYVSGHPLRGYRHLWEEKNIVFISELLSSENNLGKIGGKIVKVSRKTSKLGNPLLRIRLLDLSGEVEILVLPKFYEKYSSLIDKKGFLILEVRVEREEDKIESILAGKLEEFMEEADLRKQYRIDTVTTTKAETYEEGVCFQLSLPFEDAGLLNDLKQILEDYRGNCPVQLYIRKEGWEAKLELNNHYLKSCPESRSALTSLLTSDCVRITPII